MTESITIELLLNGVFYRTVDFLTHPMDHYKLGWQPKETVHETKGGNYCDQWGIGAGKLDFSCQVILDSAKDMVTGKTRSEALDVLYDILFLSKKQGPADPIERSVRYHNFTRNHYFVVTLSSLEIEQGSDKSPVLAHVSISSRILENLIPSQGTMRA